LGVYEYRPHKSMKVLLIDDHTLFRQGLCLLLERMGGAFEILEAGDCEAAFEIIKLNSDLELVLLDLGLPDMPGLEALDFLRSHHPAIPVVVISAANDRPSVLEAINRGAMGFIPKSSDSALLTRALQMVLAKEVYIPANVFAAADPSQDRIPAVARQKNMGALQELGLTGRQIEVLSLLVQGLPNKLIARKLGLSEATVKTHMAAAFRSLNVGNRTQAVLALGKRGYSLQ
jgi:DNA-binding NarL/FixJ family response regulator